MVTSLFTAWLWLPVGEEIEIDSTKPRIAISTVVDMPPIEIELPAPPHLPVVVSARLNTSKPTALKAEDVPETESPEQTPRVPISAAQQSTEGEALEPPALTITRRAASAGRALLRKLEAGDGPSIEIAWPETSREREALYRSFVKCHGMVTAILVSEGHLYRANETPGQSWRPNHDIFSQYAHESSGGLTPTEQILMDRIRRHHGLAGGVSVRLFPRDADALLLAGLHGVAGEALTRGENLYARYEISKGKIEIRDIRVGFRLMPGRIDFGLTCN